MKTWLKGKKSYLISTIGILTAVLGYTTDELTLWQAGLAILAALGVSAGRAAIKKIEELLKK